jgi:hypothetical protein
MLDAYEDERDHAEPEIKHEVKQTMGRQRPAEAASLRRELNAMDVRALLLAVWIQLATPCTCGVPQSVKSAHSGVFGVLKIQ